MLRVCDEDFSRILVSYFQYQRKFRDSTLTKICGCFIYTFICVIQTAASLFATRCNKVVLENTWQISEFLVLGATDSK